MKIMKKCFKFGNFRKTLDNYSKFHSYFLHQNDHAKSEKQFCRKVVLCKFDKSNNFFCNWVSTFCCNWVIFVPHRFWWWHSKKYVRCTSIFIEKGEFFLWEKGRFLMKKGNANMKVIIILFFATESFLLWKKICTDPDGDTAKSTSSTHDSSVITNISPTLMMVNNSESPVSKAHLIILAETRL